jgi:hypothetical protein
VLQKTENEKIARLAFERVEEVVRACRENTEQGYRHCRCEIHDAS